MGHCKHCAHLDYMGLNDSAICKCEAIKETPDTSRELIFCQTEIGNLAQRNHSLRQTMGNGDDHTVYCPPCVQCWIRCIANIDR